MKVKLGEVAEIIMGQSPDSSSYNYEDGLLIMKMVYLFFKAMQILENIILLLEYYVINPKKLRISMMC